jgi:hypothetical protein
MTHGECMAMLAVAGKVYGEGVAEDVVEAWAQFMADVTPEEGAAAMREHITESPHFPKVADIRKRVAAHRVNAPDVAAAWGEVLRQVRLVGYYGLPQFSHPAIAAAVDALGWQEVCHTPTDQLGTLRAQFERYFRSRLETGARAANAGALEEHRRHGAISAGDALKQLLGKKPGGEED